VIVPDQCQEIFSWRPVDSTAGHVIANSYFANIHSKAKGPLHPSFRRTTPQAGLAEKRTARRVPASMSMNFLF
jgi:hypothetical protein